MSIFPKPHPDGPGQVPSPGSERVREFSNSDPVAAILKLLRQGQRFLVCSHLRPDGDSLGSMLGCGMLLKQMGKHADLITADPIPEPYRSLPGADSIGPVPRQFEAYDAVIVLECDGIARTGLEREGLPGLEKLFLINIDHHISGRPYADMNWIDYEAPSVGEMVYRLLKAAGLSLTPELATCLYTTVLTDTGGFCYGSVKASTFAWAEELVSAGADPVRIAQDVCLSTPFSRMQLLGAALGNLHRDGSVAWLWVTLDDVARTGAIDGDFDGIVNFAVGIVGIEAAVFLRELPDGHIRLSLRSKGQLSVAAIAERLGGGGHKNAAGCTLDGPLDRALEIILPQLRDAVTALQPFPSNLP